ncbi:MAG: methylmalonyl-CoA mutase family protein [Elusimicrobiota bacterium]
MNEKIKVAKQKWEAEKVAPLLSAHPERKKKFETSSLEIARLYTPSDLDEFDYLAKLSFPGEFPYTRGVQPTMYRGRLWTMRQYAGFGTSEDTNKRYKYLLKQGQTGLSVAFDLPTQIGYDSDHQLSEGEVGKVGVAIDSLFDMEKLFDGIPLDKVTVSMTINSTAAIILAMYIIVAKKQNIDISKLSGTVQNDLLKEYIARGTYIFPPEPSLRLTTDIISYCSKNLPKWNAISISGYHIREAGANAVQEVAFTLSDGIEYLNHCIKAGLSVDSIAPQFSFFFGCHNNFLEEVAKFRAARRLWAKIMKERFHSQNPKSQMLRFHTQTDGCTLTAQQSENNIVRVTLQALAAVLGGTQSLHTNSKDEAVGLPTEESVRIALRTQQLIAEESGVCDTIDPLGGAYAIETLTDSIEKQAAEYIRKIDEIGGMVKAIENGFIQQEIQESAYQYQKAIETGEMTVIGVNRYQTDEKPKQKLQKVSQTVEKKQVLNLRKLKSKRDNKKVESAVKKIEKIAKMNENLMPVIIEAVENYATVGEICDVLRNVFGEYQPSRVI